MQLVNDFYVKSFCVVCFFVKRAAKIGVFNLLPNNFRSYFTRFVEMPAPQGFQLNNFLQAFLHLIIRFQNCFITVITNIPLLCSTDFNILCVQKISIGVHHFL